MTRSDPKRDRTVGRAEPWTLEGPDAEALVLAQQTALRSGMSLAELLNRMLAEGVETPASAVLRAAATAPPQSPKRRSTRSSASSKPARVAGTAEGHVAEDVERTLSPPARQDRVERSLAAVAVLLEAKLDELSERHDAALERLESLEAQRGSRLEASKALEAAIGKVAAQIHEGEARAELQALHDRDVIRFLRARVERLEAVPETATSSAQADLSPLYARLEALEAGRGFYADAAPAEAALSALALRVEDSRQQTLGSLQALAGAIAGLERSVHGDASFAADETPDAVEDLWADTGERGARTLTSDAAEVARGFRDFTSDAGEASHDPIEAAVRDLSDLVVATEQRSATAISRMEEQVVRLAQSLDSRVDGVERRSDQLASEVGGEVARIADVVDACLTRADEVQAATLGLLGGRTALAVTDHPVEVSATEAPKPAAQGFRAADVEELVGPAPQIDDAPPTIDHAEANEPARRLRRSQEWSVESFAEACEPGTSAPPPTVEASHRTALQPPPRAPEIEAPIVAEPPAASIPPRMQPDESEEFVEAVEAADPAPVRPEPLIAEPLDDDLARVKAAAAEALRRQAAAAPASASPTRSGSNRELIEQARTAARLNAESKRRPPMELWAGKGDSKSDPAAQSGEAEDVLDLRNGFGLLKPRRRQGAGG